MSVSHSSQRVYITGMGALTPQALGAEQSWTAVRQGISGIDRLNGMDLEGMAVQIGGQVAGFDPAEHLSHQDCRRLSPSTQYGVVAGREAMASAGIDTLADGRINPERFAVLSATGYGPTEIIHHGTRTIADRGPRAVSPYTAIFGAADAVSSFLSVELGALGPSHAVSAACASGTVGLGEALRTIRHGYADAILVIGSEDSINRQDMAATANMRALAADRNEDPKSASRPFDRARSGFVMSAGASALLVESEDSIQRRGGAALAEVLGFGSSSDAHHATAPHPEGRGAQQAIREALQDAGLAAEAVDYVNAHGTGTPYNDRTELAAITAVFGEQAHRVPISSTKSTTGHMIGAAGTVEAMFCVQSMRDGFIPPTVNLDEPEFQDFDLVPHHGRRVEVSVAMSNSFGFGGHNATVLLGRAA
ncbi:beta-ketoacyl-[acyl-carrier-protein] synthase family protein [Citricoccus nitrophenolicus]|uniref:beta-ketoacyl-[acyl-carrier-protein] synthase family protein n=1 Tax=Citricoccus nitrophenolicus TaxID=863575 RepID=UPI0031F1A5F6